MSDDRQAVKTAAEAGWHVSRYNLSARVPDTGQTVVVNLLRGTCATYSPIELYVMSALDEISEKHPLLGYLAGRGLICNYDELAALEANSRIACLRGQAGIVICPTMACNFDCPYCFEDHVGGKMTPEVQDDVVALAGRLLDMSGSKALNILWLGGEPLCAPDVIESLSGRLIALANGRGVAYNASIITNGYLLSQDMVDMLARCKVSSAQVTLDGIGPMHDKTRHLAGGGSTFERIVSNLRDTDIPFPVHIRHNVYEGNRDGVEGLERFVEELAKESGNKLNYFNACVVDSEAGSARGHQVALLGGSAMVEVAVDVNARRFQRGRSTFCGANNLVGVAVDHLGNLHMCWEAVSQPRFSFGTARDWDPANPLETAAKPDILSGYLNEVGPITDPVCRECVWLPHCVGGCPHRRLFEQERPCVPYRDDPEAYVLAVYAKQSL